MIKALLIITSLGINTEMPDMDSCLKARTAIMKQDATIKTLCVPKQDEMIKVGEMFDVFMNIVDTLKKESENEKRNRQTNQFCPDCKE
jgi:hypothetical protein